MAELLPLLYLHGPLSSDFGPALGQFLGSGAGLSAPTITRLTTQWQDEAVAFGKRSLAGADYVYMWVDGNHPRAISSLVPSARTPITTSRHTLSWLRRTFADGHRESCEYGESGYPF